MTSVDISLMLRSVTEVSATFAKSVARFTPFDFVRGDELGLSAILRWLLDPDASHGEGDRFLRLFFAAYSITFEESDLARVHVECEAVTLVLGEPRRIDVKLRFGRRCIAIENKPWAAWQKRQLWAYWSDVSRDPRHGGESHCHVLVLRGNVREIPPDQRQAIPQDRLIDTDYVAFETLVRRFAAGCIAGPARDFILDYTDHLAREFSVGVPDPMKMAITDKVFSDPLLIEAAIDLVSARGEVLARLATMFSQQVRQHADANGIVVAVDDLSSVTMPGKDVGVALKLEPETNYVFAINFEGAGLHWPYIGLAAKDETTRLRLSIPSPPIGFEGPSKEWAWWQYLAHMPEWADLADERGLLRALHDGSLADRFIARFLEVQDSMRA